VSVGCRATIKSVSTGDFVQMFLRQPEPQLGSFQRFTETVDLRDGNLNPESDNPHRGQRAEGVAINSGHRAEVPAVGDLVRQRSAIRERQVQQASLAGTGVADPDEILEDGTVGTPLLLEGNEGLRRTKNAFTVRLL
jgi:hypothetical protein